MIFINGSKCPESLGKTLADYLDENSYNAKLIAVEMNGSILKKCDYASTIIRDEDTIEIVSFVGGG